MAISITTKPATQTAITPIVASYKISSSYTQSNAGESINFDTVIYDPNTLVTTGGSNTWRFTAPVSGYYSVKCVFESTVPASASMAIYKNNTFYRYIGTLVNTGIMSGALDTQMTSGDTLYIGTDNGGVTFDSQCTFSIHQIK